MKAIQIEKLLTGMFEKFLESITDVELRERIKKESFIAGGCIPSMLMDEWVNDFDVYFTSRELATKVWCYYQKQIEFAETNTNPGALKIKIDKGNGYWKITWLDDIPKNVFTPIFISGNAITLTDKIQCITKWAGEPKEVVEKFDWAHLRSYYKYPKLHLDPNVYRLITEKDLIYTGSDYPLSSMMRMQKYTKKGWKITATDQLKIALDMARLDLTNLEVLKEQMNGIDPTYMMSILDKIENKKWDINDLIDEINKLTSNPF